MPAKNSHNHQLKNSGLDGLGLALSGLCLVHCLFLPVMISILPLASWLEDTHLFHLGLGVILVPLAMVALWRGYRKHLVSGVIAGGTLGIVFLIGGILSHPSHSQVPVTLTVLGSLILSISHWCNWRWSRCQSCANHGLRTEIPPIALDGPKASANDFEPEHPG